MEPRAGTASPLTDVAAVARALAEPAPPGLLDVRWRLGGPPGIQAYRAGHLPGAAFVDLDADLAAARPGGMAGPGRGGLRPRRVCRASRR